jgi:hypothetical protein
MRIILDTRKLSKKVKTSANKADVRLARTARRNPRTTVVVAATIGVLGALALS